MPQTTRHLKIFISSTFRDMQGEREVLLKETFLELKQIARKRDVEITEIDLRTGITKEQEESGKIVQICLDEIERCKESPIFFLGMIGERYGWNGWYEKMDKSILENKKYSWIEKHKDVSVTELEIMAALKSSHNKAFIYLKESKEDEDIKLYWMKDSLERIARRDKDLKVDFYKDTKEFKEKTLNSLKEALDEVYPETKKLSEVEKLRAIHQAFSKSRQKVYIAHWKNEIILDEFIASDKDRLLIYGKSGYGKSALIANYFDTYKKNHNSFVIEHYIGGAGELSSDIYQILRRIMLEIKDEFTLDDNVPRENEQIINDFSQWLQKVKRRTIVILDGYNQIDNEIKKKLFYYLPKNLGQVKLILTSIEDDYIDENKHKIEPLKKDEQRKLIIDYMHNYGKTLDEKSIINLLRHSQIENTLFLTTILNEIRLLGNFEELSKDIEDYLCANDTVELFMKIFTRLEVDYGEMLCEDVFSLLYVSRDGLSETNLMEILKLNRLEFSPLFLALVEHLVDRDGLYKFFHSYIEEAIEKKYLFTNEQIEKQRRKIVNYFEDKDIDRQKVRELPYQLYALKERNKLLYKFYNIYFFVDINDENEYELLKYVRFIDEGDRDTCQELMSFLFKVKKNLSSYEIGSVANFMDLYGKYDIAMELHREALELKKEKHGEYHTNVVQSYNSIANLYGSLGKYREAISYLEKALKIDEYLDSKNDDMLVLYNGLGVSYGKLGEYEKSKEYLEKVLNMRKDFYGENHVRTALAYSNLGILFETIGEYEKSEELLIKSLEIRKRLNGEKHLFVSESYHNLGLVYEGVGNHEKAEAYYIKSLDIKKSILGEHHPSVANTFSNMAALYHRKGEYEKARPYYEMALKIRENILGENHYDTSISYNNFAGFLTSTAEYDQAIVYSKKALAILINTLGEKHYNITPIYDRLARIYRKDKKYEKALIYYKKALRIREDIFGVNHKFTSTSYNNIALAYDSLKEYDNALYFHKKALKINKNECGEESYDVGLSYQNMALTYHYQEKYEKAFELYMKSIDILIKIDREEHPTIATVYYNLGKLCNTTGELEKAKEYLLKSIKIYEKNLADDHPYLIAPRDLLIKVEEKMT